MYDSLSLTHATYTQVDRAWGPGKMSEILVKKGGIAITRDIIRRLNGQSWLKDEVSELLVY